MKEKNGLKKTLAVFLVVVLLLTTAPLAGFVGLEFPRLNFGGWLDSVGEWFGNRASAETWENLTYEVSNGEAKITDCSTSISGAYTIPSTLGGYPVTSIGDSSFDGCTGLTSVTIPDSVTIIGSSAFMGCTGLSSITIPDSVTSIGFFAFSGCIGLTSITIPDSVGIIAGPVFENCTGLISITIGSGAQGMYGIWGRAFRGCNALKEINISQSNPYYSSENGIVYNKDKTELKQYPSGKEQALYTIPDSVTSIGSSAFEDCIGLTSITIPDSVTSIGNYAFRGCTGLTGITIPDSVTSIGSSAFSGCTGLTSITIPDGVTSIEAYAFRGCTSLTSITVSSGNTVYHSADNCMIETETRTLISGCKSSIIPTDGSVTSIGSSAFEGCTGLTSITIPDSVTSIGDSAFRGCTGLTSVTIPDSVTSIGSYAFKDCNELLVINCHENSPAYEYAINNFIAVNCISDCDHSAGSVEETVEPTCTEAGALNKRCSVCNAILSSTAVAPLGHSFTDYISDNNATCTADGTKTAKCDRCDVTDTVTDENTVLGHDFVFESEIKATCTKTGLKTEKCSRCGLSREKVIPVSAHRYRVIFNQGAENSVYLKCKDCLNEYTFTGSQYYYRIYVVSVDDADGWDLAEWKLRRVNLSDFSSVDSPVSSQRIDFLGEKVIAENNSSLFPTCFTFDYQFGGGLFTWRTLKAKYYLKIGNSIDDAVDIPLDIYVNSVSGTVTVDGQNVELKSSSGKAAKGTITAAVLHDHSYKETVIAPKCTAKGYTEAVCVFCGNSVFKDYTDPLGHDYKAEHIDATEGEDGYTLYTCSRCGDNYSILDPAAAVEGLQAFAGTYRVSLSWLKAVEASVTGYNVYRKAPGEMEYTLVNSISGRNTTSYIDTDVVDGNEYFYYVTALKGEDEGNRCEPVSCVPYLDEEAPRVFKLEPSVSLDDVIYGNISFAVNAEDNVGVEKVELYYCAEGSDDWTFVAEDKGVPANIAFDTHAVPDGRYNFKAVAYDAQENRSSDDLIKTFAVDNTGPEKVKGLSVKAVYSTKATIAWENVSDKDIDHFILRKKIADGYVTVSGNIKGQLGFNLTSLSPETEYTYCVAGVDRYGNIGEYSDDFTFSTMADTTAPVVSKVLPSPGRYNRVIDFSVTTEDDHNILKIEVIASTNLNEWTKIDEKVFSGISANRSQKFSVSLESFDEGNLFLAAVAYDNAGNSSAFGSEAAYVRYIVDKTAPAAPKNVQASGGDRQIVVSWDQGSESDLGKYNVYRATQEDGEFSLLASNLAKLDYYDTSVTDGVTYYYKVAVSDVCGNMSTFSSVVFANLSNDDKKPVITSIGLGGGAVCGPNNKTVSVLAQDNKYISRIVLEYKRESDAEYSVLSEKTYSDKVYYKILEADLPLGSFSNGEKIFVRAYCADTSGLLSDYSAEKLITVDKTAPDVCNVNYSLNGGQYTLSWTGNGESDVSGYRVYYSKDGGSNVLMASRGYNSSGAYSVSVTLGAGSYNIYIDAVDNVGNVRQQSCPSIVIKGTTDFRLEAAIDCPSYFEVGAEEVVSAAGTVSSEGIVSYSWEFGDGTTSGAKQFNKRYLELGNYEIKLTVEDNNGNVATATKSVVVKPREMLGTVRAVVIDDSSNPVRNAEVYFGLGEDNQQVVYTNSQGVAELVMSVGAHSIGALSDTTKYLPAETKVSVVAGRTTEVKLILVQKPLVDLDLTWHEMTFEEIVAAGIDISDPANRQLISGTITVKYTTTGGSSGGGSSTGIKIIEYIGTPSKIIDFTIEDIENHQEFDPYVFTPVLINTGTDKNVVAVLAMPAEASFLKQFYDVTLYVTNNAESKFPLIGCEASLNVPSGLSIVSSTPISSIISGGGTASASWIVRGEAPGEYNISADFSGTLDVFNKHVSANVASNTPITVRGLDGITLRAVFNTMIKCNTLYFNFILENDSGYDIYSPNVDYNKVIENIMIDAPKKKDDAEIKTECLGVSLIDSDDVAESFDVEHTFDVLHDGEKLKYEFKTEGLANDKTVGYYTEGTVDCLPQFKDHIVVEEDYIFSYDGEEEVVKYTEKYKDVFSNQNGIVLRFFNNTNLTEYKVDYLIGSDSGETHKKLKNVTVEYGDGQVQCVDEEFAAKFSEVKGHDIVVKADGFRTKVYPAEAIEKWATYFSISQKIRIEDVYLEQDHKDGKPYITSAVGKENLSKGIKTYTDLTASKLAVTCVAPCDIIIKAELAGGTNATYWLSQDEEHKISNSDGNFNSINIHEVFEADHDIYAYVMTEKNGETVVSDPIMLKIEIQNLEAYSKKLFDGSTLTLMSTSGQSLDIDDDVPLMGGSNISMNLLSFPIGVRIEGDQVRVSLGVDIFSRDFTDKKNEWFDFKASVNKWQNGVEQAMKRYEASAFGSVAEKGKTFTLDFYGYLEGSIVNGTFVPTDVSASLKGDFKYCYSQQGVIYCIPAYAYAEASYSVAIKAAYARMVPDYNIPLDFGFVLSINPSLKVGGGGGIHGAVSAGVFANGVVEYTNDFPKQHHKLKLTGTFGVEAELFFLKWDKNIYEGTWTPVDSYYGSAKDQKAMLFGARAFSAPQWSEKEEPNSELVSRDYLENTTDWEEKPITAESIGATTGTLIESIYPNSDNQIVRFKDKLLQVFVEDDESRDGYNFARLMYSVFDDASQQWSKPKPVYDNGHFDSTAKLCVDENGTVHVIWQKLDASFSSDNGNVEEILKSSEIYYATYDEASDSFTNVRKLTDDALYDSLASICAENGKVVAYWIKNNDNNLLSAGSNSLMKCVIGESEQVLVSSMNYVSDIASCNGEVSVIYDTDGDTATVEDRTVASYSSDGSCVFEKEIDNLTFVEYGGSTLYFTTYNAIGYLGKSGEISYITNDTFSPRNLNVFTDSAFWVENNSIMYSELDNKVWSEPVVIEEDSGNVSDMTVEQIGDYAYVVYNSTDVIADEEGNESAGRTDMKFVKIGQYVDLGMHLYLLDEYKILEGEENNVEMYIENNGNTTVEKVSVSVSDTLGNESSIVSQVNLAPGSGKVVKLSYKPKEGYTRTLLTATVAAVSSLRERTPDDNVVKTNVGLCDLLIERNSIDTIGDNYFLSAVVSNSSYITAEGISVETYFDSQESEPVDTHFIDTLAVGESLYINIPLCKENIAFDENKAAKVYLKVASSSEESITENNSVCFVLSDHEERCGHPEKTLVSSKAATCTAEGINVYTCNVCGEALTETIPTVAHTLGTWVVITAPTCTSVGEECSKCIYCEYTESRAIDITAHRYSDSYTVDVPATCTQAGEKSRHCLDCAAKTDITVIAALGHSYGEYVVTAQPTCTESGVEAKTCTVCGDKQTRTVAALGHFDNDNDGKCDRCGEKTGDPAPSDPSQNCSCNCHKKGIANFFFKILLFFQKIFKKNKVCNCGVYHY